MSDALRQSLKENIEGLQEIQHEVISSGLDFSFDQEQLTFQIEGLVSELRDSVDQAIKFSGE